MTPRDPHYYYYYYYYYTVFRKKTLYLVAHNFGKC